ncbi:hypothetical protein QWJ34_22820 [Saccharibacillus sp. CPCC 101409]|uniref:hypothetical protein n=1 Tax=Saccharibacillus sp. CPCC 101409 TaxID=3058041 RepID=UPI00267195A7|nr:hypothetical protein [Saccharibacillus sp. CPCC 101409]MDO3412617.1 hypothetical protein [Saccharibacillus sp. CPCC 101409]
MKENFRQAWLIVVRELRIDRYYLLASLLFILYMAVFAGLMISALDREPRFSLLADLLFWLAVSGIGYYFSKRIFKYITQDSYTHMLAYYRTLPIPPQALALARILQMVMSFIVNGIVFFGLMYTLYGELRQLLGIGAYIGFALTWTGLALLTNALYIVMECLMKGKAYFWYSFVLMIGVTAIMLILRLTGIHPLEESIRTSARLGMASPVMWLLLAAGIASAYWAYRTIVRRLPKRNLA